MCFEVVLVEFSRAISGLVGREDGARRSVGDGRVRFRVKGG